MTSSDSARTRICIMISGAGSNMAALIEASHRPKSAYQVALVISNRPEAAGLLLADAQGIATMVIDHRPFGPDRLAHEQAIHNTLNDARTDVVALAGYMRVLTPWLVDQWSGRILNIHPSLLPRYPGLNTHARAIDAGDTEAGCTIHLVTAGVDEGPILGQASVPILKDDTAPVLAERVKVAEHALYAQTLDRFCVDLR